MSEQSSRSLVKQIGDQLDAADGMVDNTVEFVLRAATVHLRGAGHSAAADLIDPDRMHRESVRQATERSLRVNAGLSRRLADK